MTVEQAYAGIQDFPKPTIAMIRGYCIGGGLGLAVCCDLRICSDNSRFAVPAAKLGLGYAYSGLKRLIDLVGPGFAREIFFTARQFDSEEARAMGLVNRVVPQAELEGYVKDYAETIAANAPLTVKAVKYIVGEVAQGRIEARHGALRRGGGAVLRQQRLHRGAPRLHGEAQAGLHRDVARVTSQCAKVDGSGEPTAPPPCPSPAGGGGTLRRCRGALRDAAP